MQQTTSTYNNKNKTSKKVDLRNRRDMEATKTKTTSTSNRKTISKSDGLASSSKAAVTVTATVTNKPTLGATVASTIISTLNSISKSSTLSNQQPSLNGNNESLAGNSSSDNNDSNNEIGDDYTLIRSNSTLYSNYRPEVGVRTGLILAGMLLFIIFYILWRNRCRCLRRGHGSSSSDDLDMEFWLKHVDKQKEAAQKRRNLYRNSGVGSLGSPSGVALLQLVPSLPETVSDPHESTAAWVQDHRKIWQQMSREAASKRAVTANAATPVNLFHTRFSSAFLHPSQPPATEPIVAASGGLIDHILLRSASSAAVIPTRQIPRENLPSSPPPLQSPTTPGGGGGGNSSGGVFFGGKFARIISPFKRFAHVRESVNFSISGGSRRRFSQRGRRRKSPSDRVLVGAGTAVSGPFEEIDPQTQLLINYARFDADQVHHTTFGKQISDIIRPLHQLHHHEPTNGSSSNIELKHVNTANNPNLTIMPQVMIIESSDTTFNIQEQRVDVEEKILSDDKSNTEEDEQQEQFMRHALLSILLLNRRRRHSWPRCRHDNLQFNSFNREVRGLLFQHGHGSKMAYEYQNQNRNRHLNSPNSRHSNSNQMNNNSTIGSYNHSSNNMMMKTSLKSDNNSRK